MKKHSITVISAMIIIAASLISAPRAEAAKVPAPLDADPFPFSTTDTQKPFVPIYLAKPETEYTGDDPEAAAGEMLQGYYAGSSAQASYGYWIYVPDSYNQLSDGQMPLIVSLHGANGTGVTLERMLNCDIGMATFLYQKKTSPNAIVLMPQSPTCWWYGYNVAQEQEGCAGLMELIEHIVEAYNVDRDRIYLTGVSRGGMVTYRMLLYYPDYFAAAMPIASAGDPNECASIKTPLRIYHGEQDLSPMLMGPSVLAIAENISGNGGTCELYILEGVAHGGQHIYYDTKNYDAMEWLLAQKNSANPRIHR